MLIDFLGAIIYTHKKGKAGSKVKASYSTEEKDTRKSRQNYFQIYSFNSILTQYVFIKSLLYARHCARHWKIQR